MNYPLRVLLQKFPEGYVKSVLKNVSSYIMNNIPHQVEEIVLQGIKIKIYKDGVLDNKHLAKEISGYNAYYKLQKGDIVIDAGAYTGMYTLFAAKKVGPTGKVIAYEPDPYNSIMLAKNLKLNNISNVTIVKRGLFDKKATVGFDIQSIGSNITSLNHAFHNRKTLNTINVVSIDDEVTRLKLRKINFIKMDIEGAEIEAMKGAKKTLKKFPMINLAIASYHVVNGEKTSIFLEKFFKKLSMKVKTEKRGQLTTYISYKMLKQV